MIWGGIDMGWVSKIFGLNSYVNEAKDNHVLEEIKTGPILNRTPS